MSRDPVMCHKCRGHGGTLRQCPVSPWVIPHHKTWSSLQRLLVSVSDVTPHPLFLTSSPSAACKVYKGHFHGHLWPLCPVIRDNGSMSQVSPIPSLVSSDPQTGLKAVSPLSLTNSLDLPLYSFCLRATSLQIRCLVTEPGAA